MLTSHVAATETVFDDSIIFGAANHIIAITTADNSTGTINALRTKLNFSESIKSVLTEYK